LPRSYKFVIAMVDWMHDQMYIPNSNGDAGQDFEKLIAEINNVAVAYKNELQERMDKMDDKIFFKWVLPTVGGFINGTDGGGGQPKGRGG